jgi:Kef-type K+ transport system membrane component KefB
MSMAPLELASRFVRPLLAWIEATPVHVLLVCFVLLIVFGLACV